jgi:hypothetical protein
MLEEDLELPELDQDEGPRRFDRAAVKRTIADATRVVTFASFVVVFAAAVIGNWQRSQNVDPEYTYDIVLRTIRFGGTYYENGIHNKGPLETFVYQAATWISTHDSFWYAISLFIAIAALIIGTAAARTAQSFGANRDLGIAAAVVVFVHFALGPSDYAGVLYARNMTTPLLALAWIILLWDRAWSDRRRALAAAVTTGALLGIAVQTLLSTAFAAIPVALVVLGLLRLRRPRAEHARLDLSFVGAGALAFASAPIWYLIRGKFDEFFSGWWTYARFMNSGTGRSLGGQFALGWDQFYAYYQQRPFACVVILAFLAMTAIEWSRAGLRQRLLGLGLVGWFAGAWIELVLAQRYSSHYFSVTSTPTALMAAALAGRVYRAIAAQRRVLYTFAWPMLALVLAIYLTGPKQFVQDMQDFSKFTSPHAHAVEVEQAQAGDTRAVRAVLDLVSKDWDPLLVWTNDPWPYLDYHRVSATRFIWKSFLTGEIYLGRTSNSYVLPKSWDWFREDLEESKPVAFVHSNGGPISAAHFAEYVSANFTSVYPDSPIPVEYRNDVAAQVLTPNVPDAWTPPAPPDGRFGWTLAGDGARFRDQGARDQRSAWLPIATDSCFTFQGNVDSDGPPGGIVFRFEDNARKSEQLNLNFDGDHVSSASSTTEFHRLPSDVTTSGRTPEKFTLIVNHRAAALVVRGQIRAAVRLPKSVTVSIESQRGILNLTDLRKGPAPAVTGC